MICWMDKHENAVRILYSDQGMRKMEERRLITRQIPNSFKAPIQWHNVRRRGRAAEENVENVDGTYKQLDPDIQL